MTTICPDLIREYVDYLKRYQPEQDEWARQRKQVLQDIEQVLQDLDASVKEEFKLTTQLNEIHCRLQEGFDYSPISRSTVF
jgi:hypothetical protein